MNLTVDEFLERIDELVGYHGLVPNLPEIVGLKQDAADCLDNPLAYLELLNPAVGINWDGLTLVVQEQLPGEGRILKPWTIADCHLGQGTIASASARIEVNDEGTHFVNTHGLEIVRFRAGHTSAHLSVSAKQARQALRNAVSIITHYVDLDLEPGELYGMQSMKFVKFASGKWSRWLTISA